MRSKSWFSGKIKTVHFVGIGGIGMSGLAEILLNLGFHVQGSDARESAATHRLRDLGATVFIGHAAWQIEKADVVVHTSAVRQDNPEILAAWKSRLPVIRRAELLAELMRLQSGIAVAGTHGKTTTTSLVALVLSCAGLSPTVVIGGNAKNIGANARVGDGRHLVAEADESDASFLYLTPEIAVVTNIEEDHLDHYRDIGQIISTFRDFLERVPFFGAAVVCGDDRNIRSIIRTYRRRLLRYGLAADNDLIAALHPPHDGSQPFSVSLHGKDLGIFTLPVPGVHMVLNSLAAIGVAIHLDIPVPVIKDALASYQGVRRRMEIKGETHGIIVIDDYAHHPTEIRASLSALRSWKSNPITVVFEPHRYSRTKFFLDEFAAALEGVEHILILPVYAASEEEYEGITADLLIERCRSRYGDAVHAPADFNEAVRFLADETVPGSIVVTLGAGNVTQVGELLLVELEKRDQHGRAAL
ncbi:UDP-N-acetylmuramate--L-alanine ligase [bacterium]|nr:UDP-N-acetylmuramate--L-alanine ligase [candidate division CSSED10-310 bacterium]